MSISGSYWAGVLADGGTVPADRPLDDLTAELTTMLGDPDPTFREEIALPTLMRWLSDGVYDDLLAGLGDGMASGLGVGLSRRRDAVQGPTSVDRDAAWRRASSASVLSACLDRDNRRALVAPGKVLEWGDRLVGWLLTDTDPRAVAPGGAALATLARSPHFQSAELTVVLDVVADRVLSTTDHGFRLAEADAMAEATMAVLRRDKLPMALIEPWIVRLGNGALGRGGAARNAETFLRALYLHVSVGRRTFAIRPDLVLLLVDVLREIDPHLR